MAYYVHLQQFDGPMDLLLYLVEKYELDIQDIFVSEITGQYLEYMKQIDALDMDKASEFLAMAATLIYIKSRHLLPRMPQETSEETEDEETRLIRQLREYKLFKEAGEELRTLEAQAKNVFTRLPEEFAFPQKEIQLQNVPYTALLEALRAVLEKSKPDEPSALHQVQQDRYTVRGQLQKIRSVLRGKPSIRFEELFRPDAVKMEIIVTFMALLEMISRGEILLRQKEPFAPIRISAEHLIKDDAHVNYMDEDGEADGDHASDGGN